MVLLIVEFAMVSEIYEQRMSINTVDFDFAKKRKGYFIFASH